MPTGTGEKPQPPEQLTWLLQPELASPIRQENRLVQARYHLSARELKLVLYVCAMVDVNAKDFGKCRIRIEDFAKLTGSDPHSLYYELRATAKEVRRKDLILENYPETDEHGNVRFETKTLSWFKEVSERGERDGYLSVTLNERLKPFLLEVRKNYTEFQLGYTVRMESKYSIRLYQFLRRWLWKGERTVSLDELRLCLSCREVNANGRVIKDYLKAYKNFKQKALTPAVEEINEKSDLSVEFWEQKARGSKAISALRFLITTNPKNEGKFGEVRPSNSAPPTPGDSEAATAELDGLTAEFGLSKQQVETVRAYVRDDGLSYVLEKAEIARKQKNPPAAFIKALREDWKKPALKTSNTSKSKPKAPPPPPELPPPKPDLEPTARLWQEATELQRSTWLQDGLIRDTQPKNGERPRLVFLARLYTLTHPEVTSR